MCLDIVDDGVMMHTIILRDSGTHHILKSQNVLKGISKIYYFRNINERLDYLFYSSCLDMPETTEQPNNDYHLISNQ